MPKRRPAPTPYAAAQITKALRAKSHNARVPDINGLCGRAADLIENLQAQLDARRASEPLNVEKDR